MFTVVIPARYASTRLPGKPLLDIGGIPMIQHVWRRAVASGAGRTIIATDDARISSACRGFGAQVEMTSTSHASGTERIAEVAARLSFPDNAVVVNVQGDEPFIPPSLISQVAGNLASHGDRAEVATLCGRIRDPETVFDPDVVKVVADESSLALYFSRAPIPWEREAYRQQRPEPDARGVAAHFRHIGIYAYRAGYLRTYASLAPSTLEKAERLEQLRILYHGGRIHVAEAVESPGPGVDSPGDLELARRLVSV